MSTLEMTTAGNPGWIGHAGPDPSAAQTFYGDVLGWHFEAMPMQDGTSYATVVVDGVPVGGFAPTPAADGAWTVYVTVADVDAAVERAEAAGGRVLDPAADMPGVGRMATLADPFGARFAVIAYAAGAAAGDDRR